MRRLPEFLVITAIVLLLIVLLRPLLSSDSNEVRARLVGTSPAATGFTRAEGPRPFDFPADFGSHPDYQSEWWYYTGNLETSDGRHFGYQLTFFRRTLVPPADRQNRASSWATNHVYMAHFALSDMVASRYQAYERFSRGAAGLAGVQASPYQVWLEDWSVEELNPGVYNLRAAQDDVTIELRLNDLKGPILQGDQGYSQKGPEPGNASYYYSLTRLASAGTVQVGDQAYDVEGWSWMDHEYSTSALGSELVGWDWFSIQLDDGGELMAYQFRKEDGTIDTFSSGTYIGADGRTTRLNDKDFTVSVEATWRSPHSTATYPARWTITVPSEALSLEVTPHLADQELQVSFTYWEGAVRVVGQQDGNPVTGNGYVELTGYAGSMQGQF